VDVNSLSDEQHEEIRVALKNGAGYKKMAEDTGLSQVDLRKIKTGPSRTPVVEPPKEIVPAHKQVVPPSPNLPTDTGSVIKSLKEFVARGSDRLVREAETMDINRLTLSLGIAIDKIQLISGQATQRVETVQKMPQSELIEKLKSMKKAKAKVIDAT
jgi:hypothetical protein